MTLCWRRGNWRQKVVQVLLLGLFCAPIGVRGADWPQWGGDGHRNMVSPEKGLVASFVAGKARPKSEEVDMATTQNVKWVAKLGSQTYGNPTVSAGRVFVGTNNQSPRDPRHVGDRGILLCLDATDGRLIWQLVVPKLGTGKVSDWEYLGICSSPAVEGDRVYIVTNRCEVLCLDVLGMSNGNDGPYKDEASYTTAGGPPVASGPKDADILWRYDMRSELGVFPHNITSSAVLILDDRLVVTTSNGQDWTHVYIPNPRAPALIMLDKTTGQLVAEEASGISARLFHGNWATSSMGEVGGQPLVFFGGPDGFVYAFDSRPGRASDGTPVLRPSWSFDCNPPEFRTQDGKPVKYPSKKGPSEVLATPVFHEGSVYASLGQDPEHGIGVGALSCLVAGDVGKGPRTRWVYRMDRSLSTVAVRQGLVYTADFSGYIHCVDAATGAQVWKYDSESSIWGSPLLADGRIWIGNESGKLMVFEEGRTMNLMSTIEMGAPVYATVVAAGGVLYVATQTHLYAVAPPQGLPSPPLPSAPPPSPPKGAPADLPVPPVPASAASPQSLPSTAWTTPSTAP